MQVELGGRFPIRRDVYMLVIVTTGRRVRFVVGYVHGIDRFLLEIEPVCVKLCEIVDGSRGQFGALFLRLDYMLISYFHFIHRFCAYHST